MPSLSLLKRGSQCAYHANDKSGRTWNPYGDLCPSVSDEQKPLLIAGLAICAIGLLGLAVVFVVRVIRSKRHENEPLEVPQRPADVMGSPLLKEKRSSRFHDDSMASRNRSNSLAPGSPLSAGGNDFQVQQHVPYRDQQNLRVDHGSQSSHSSHSAYSPRPESLHFPILSSNGQLLPRPPASSRNSYVEASDPFGPQRGLPTPPPVAISEPRPQLGRPVDQWQYIPETTPSPERENFYNSRHREPSVEVLRDDRTRAYAGIPQPQAATYHRSMSAEGEDMSEVEYGSEEDHDHRRSHLVYNRR